MAGRFNLKLRAHFFNKIGPSRHFAASQNLVCYRGIADFGKPSARQAYGFTA
jgi:hypothetical protein